MRVWVDLSNTYPYLDLDHAYPGSLQKNCLQLWNSNQLRILNGEVRKPRTVRLRDLELPKRLGDYQSQQMNSPPAIFRIRKCDLPENLETFGLDETDGAVTGTEQHDCDGAQNYDDRGNTMVQTGSVTLGGGGVALAFTFGGVSVS